MNINSVIGKLEKIKSFLDKYNASEWVAYIENYIRETELIKNKAPEDVNAHFIKISRTFFGGMGTLADLIK